MTTEEKFKAAVNVIRSLPKNGSYQPSNELMLRFYAYFKQATRGECPEDSRPPFWDLVGRAKYDAWKRLGDMSKEQAMARYVQELHSIVETMSYSDKVANFLEAPTNELDRINMDDLELIAGDVMERVRSQPNSPLASREASPVRFPPSATPSPPPASPIHQIKTSYDDDDESSEDRSDEEYIDTIENPEPRTTTTTTTHMSRNRMAKSGTMSDRSDLISQEISKTVGRLSEDLEKLNKKFEILERNFEKTRKGSVVIVKKQNLIFFMILWPILASFLVTKFFKN